LLLTILDFGFWILDFGLRKLGAARVPVCELPHLWLNRYKIQQKIPRSDFENVGEVHLKEI
jgi:hypothetical protein